MKSQDKLSNSEIGRKSENYACNYLYKNGYKIVERNWRYSRAEIDIIAKHNELLIFIEVKSRSSLYYGEPESAIDQAKERLIFDASQRYMEQNSYDWAIRFDIISILLDPDKRPIQLKHIQDVFF